MRERGKSNSGKITADEGHRHWAWDEILAFLHAPVVGRRIVLLDY
jgi:hypothetical protein